MGITVVLETEDAGVVETVEDPTNVLHRILPAPDEPGFVNLACIDWYGDTVFNYMQAPGFLAEWIRLRDRARGSVELDLWGRIQSLAERLGEERHLYLKFYGD